MECHAVHPSRACRRYAMRTRFSREPRARRGLLHAARAQGHAVRIVALLHVHSPLDTPCAPARARREGRRVRGALLRESRGVHGFPGSPRRRVAPHVGARAAATPAARRRFPLACDLHRGTLFHGGLSLDCTPMFVGAGWSRHRQFQQRAGLRHHVDFQPLSRPIATRLPMQPTVTCAECLRRPKGRWGPRCGCGRGLHPGKARARSRFAARTLHISEEPLGCAANHESHRAGQKGVQA